MSRHQHIVVIGGGITGLVTTYTLQKHANTTATLLEAGDRVGGKILSDQFAGLPIDFGAEAFVPQGPYMRALCQELGIEDELLSATTSQTNLWARGKIQPLPDGLAMGVPVDFAPILRSGLLTPWGCLRASMDQLLPPSHWPDDPSIAEVISRRLGHEVLDYLVEPLIAGRHAGRADQLSLASEAPNLAQITKERRSLIQGLKATRKAGASRRTVPPLLSFQTGTARLTERLGEVLSPQVQTLATVLSIERTADRPYLIHYGENQEIKADAIILTLPAPQAAKVIRTSSQELANELARIEYAPVSVAYLAYSRETFEQVKLEGSGFLVPRVEGRLMNACTCVNQKWARVDDHDQIVMRCSSGRAGDSRAWDLSDQELAAQLHEELVEALGVTQAPVESRVFRWQEAFPQYTIGHGARVRRLEEICATSLPGIFLAGAAYRGSGVSACAQDGLRVAERILLSNTS